MAIISVETLVKPVSDGNPSGDDLAYDPAFIEVERLAAGVPEVVMGSSVRPAVPPDWRAVGERCASLLARTKHLRLCVYLAASALVQEGLPGLRDGLALLRGVLEAHWDSVHPRLDPSDGNDPTERMNIIASIGAPPAVVGDVLRFNQRLLECPLTASRQLGRIRLLDIQVAKGEVPAPPVVDGSPRPPTVATIDAAFADTPTEALHGVADAATACLDHLRAIARVLEERAGAAAVPSFAPQESVLRSIVAHVQAQLARRGAGPGPATPDGQAAAGGGGASSARLSGDIQSTGDVLLALDKICRYYEQKDLSSPVPLLIRAAHRLVSKSFLEIARVLTPEAVRMLEDIAGVKREESNT